MESGALLDTAGRPVSGGVVTARLVDEMPEATELGPSEGQVEDRNKGIQVSVGESNEEGTSSSRRTEGEEGKTTSGTSKQKKPSV